MVSHPDRPQSNHAHLTVLQYYNMYADIIQDNNLDYMGDGFYKSKDPTNSIKLLKGKLTEDECCSKQVDYVAYTSLLPQSDTLPA